jgi:hypothetical protein
MAAAPEFHRPLQFPKQRSQPKLWASKAGVFALDQRPARSFFALLVAAPVTVAGMRVLK